MKLGERAKTRGRAEVKIEKKKLEANGRRGGGSPQQLNGEQVQPTTGKPGRIHSKGLCAATFGLLWNELLCLDNADGPNRRLNQHVVSVQTFGPCLSCIIFKTRHHSRLLSWLTVVLSKSQ